MCNIKNFPTYTNLSTKKHIFYEKSTFSVFFSCRVLHISKIIRTFASSKQKTTTNMKKALLVTFEITTRVVIDVESTDNTEMVEEKATTTAINKLLNDQQTIERFSADNITKIVYDNEMPYNKQYDV